MDVLHNPGKFEVHTLSGLGGVSGQKCKNPNLMYFKRGCVITLLRGEVERKFFYMKVSKDNQHPSRNFELNPLKDKELFKIPRKFSLAPLFRRGKG